METHLARPTQQKPQYLKRQNYPFPDFPQNSERRWAQPPTISPLVHTAVRAYLCLNLQSTGLHLPAFNFFFYYLFACLQLYVLTHKFRLWKSIDFDQIQYPPQKLIKFELLNPSVCVCVCSVYFKMEVDINSSNHVIWCTTSDILVSSYNINTIFIRVHDQR